jgi:DHA2 family multidrug resistance protein
MSERSLLQRVLLFITLSLATFMIVLDYSIANIAIPYISGDLAVSNDQGTYVITSFAVGSSIGLAMTGWLTKRVGDVKLFTLSIWLFTLLSFFCGLSSNLDMLIIGRFFQGFVSGPVIPLSQSLLISQGQPKNRTRDLAIWSMIIITAPVIGPILGGYLSDWYHWSWIFYINIPVGILCALVIWIILKKESSATERVPSDILGIILLSVFVSCLQIFLDKGQQWDWFNSDRIRHLFIATIISLSFLIIREHWCQNPFLKLRLFRIPSFSLSIVCLMVSYAIYFGTIVVVPLWLQMYMGYTAEWAGVAVSALGIAPVCLSLFTPMLIKKLGNLLTLTIGFTIFGSACFYNAFFTTDADVQHIALARFFFGMAFICYINPLIGMSVQAISTEKLPHATGMFHFIRAMVGGIGTSVFTTLWLRRTIFHHERIIGSLTPFNPFTPQARDPQSLAQLNNLVDQQAAMLAINDTFFLMGFLFASLVFILLIWHFHIRRKPLPAPLTTSIPLTSD